MAQGQGEIIIQELNNIEIPFKYLVSSLPTTEANAKLPATCDNSLEGADGHLVTD